MAKIDTLTDESTPTARAFLTAAADDLEASVRRLRELARVVPPSLGADGLAEVDAGTIHALDRWAYGLRDTGVARARR